MTSFVKILLNILSVTGLLAWGACVFVGVHFATDCSWPVSISAGVGSMLLMGFFFFLACYYSRPKAGSEFGAGVKVKKWVFIGIYFLLSILSAWYVMHAVACTTEYKESIQKKAGEEFTSLRAMISEAAGAPGSYKKYVDERLANYNNANPNHHIDEQKLNTELKDLADLYMVTSQYPAVRQEIKQFGEKASYSVEHWDIFTVSSYISELDDKKAKWDEALMECSRNASSLEPRELHEDYTPLGPTYDNLATPLVNPSLAGIGIGGIAVVLLLQIVILLSWVAVCVNTNKHATGIRHTAPGAGVGLWDK